MQRNHFELLELAKAVYKDGGGLPPSGWEVYEAVYPPYGGLGSATYVNHKKRKIAVAVRGTRAEPFSTDDLLNDFRLALGGNPNGTSSVQKQASDALNLAKKLTKESTLSAGIVDAFNVSVGGNPFYINLLLSILRPIVSLIFPGINITNLNLDSSLKLTDDQNEYMKKYLKSMKEGFPDYSVVITGHSLGAVMAELVGSILKIPTVVFESPGAKKRLQEQHGYDINFIKNNFTYYLGAPNPINTLDEHIGSGYRLYIKNVDSTDISKDYLTSCLMGSARRTGAGVFVGGSVALAVMSGGATAAAEAAVFSTVVGGGVATVATLVQVGVECFYNIEYIKRQHGLDNLSKCFYSTGDMIYYGQISTWPCRETLRAEVVNTLAGAAKSYIPFSWKNKGVHTLLFSSEEQVIEAQIKDMKGYGVTCVNKPNWL
jgi:hypothetical protein